MSFLTSCEENDISQQFVINQTSDYVKKTLASDNTGHDWWHIERVCKTAVFIAEKEGADVFKVQLAALLHDIADWKFHEGDDKKNTQVARQWFASLNLDASTVNDVCQIISEVTFKGAGVKVSATSLEAQVVQDADRLDALGAIGIARAFTYGGYKNRPFYDPEQKPTFHQSFDEYKKSQGTTINHFYEKLLLLRERMNTSAGRHLAEKRHAFMEEYLQNFFAEWNCSDLK